uniref:Zinc finger and BTB domain containing 33 n=1 Tax=Amphilophus citrinellus TaxID=61819 RepID=A0A3Q0SA54_AMPCI
MPSLKLISATDTQYSAAVLKNMNEQRSHGLFCDITIIIQDKKFRAHKTILSASSTYFHQLFTVAGQVIELNFIKPEIFEQILNYIYSSKIIRVRSDMLEELINAGQILGVKFIANLGSPLSQVKGLPGLSKEVESKSDTSTEMMPIITESFSISAEDNLTPEPSSASQPSENSDIMGVHKKHVSTSTQQGNFRIRLSDMSESSAVQTNVPKSAITGKKTVTLSTATEIDSFSSGCKVYTFYVCIVCKRPYVCLPSLRRHFNTHSWEKKYPCRYCNKVFALAEYRTKHEIHHTGERRYQCLLSKILLPCNSTGVCKITCCSFDQNY